VAIEPVLAVLEAKASKLEKREQLDPKVVTFVG
jgi:hypothetical protein